MSETTPESRSTTRNCSGIDEDEVEDEDGTEAGAEVEEVGAETKPRRSTPEGVGEGSVGGQGRAGGAKPRRREGAGAGADGSSSAKA
jgi:hypothetical protein